MKKRHAPSSTDVKAREFCVKHSDGKTTDAELHEPILRSGNDNTARRVGRKIARKAGLTESEIKKLYG